jgi:hypothetical protein
MKAALYQYKGSGLTIHSDSDNINETEAQLLLCFGAKSLLQDTTVFDIARQKFPGAAIAMCSTSGEIYNTEVSDNTVSMAAMQFANTRIETGSVKIEDFDNSYDAGEGLIGKFNPDGLTYLLVLSDGGKVNGSELVRGLNNAAGNSLLITGGLAGDGSNFHSTLVGLNSAPVSGLIVGIGFYGTNIHINHGSQGGWEMFGLEKTVTRSLSNILYEIDNKNALELYKKYLGNEAESLPGSALLFPLAVVLPDTGEQVVRTILSINEAEGSMTFAGDIPQGAQVRFMKANFDKITSAASAAALQSLEGDSLQPRIALLISCVGRKLILQSRTDEEVEAVDEIFKHKTLLTGFYSYGEISPLVKGNHCQLHNQTLTITSFYETE